MADLRIAVDDRELAAEWTDDAPDTREALAAALPLEGDATRWGEELYFSVPVDVAPENARTDVPVGAVAYWPAGNALCLFWGPPPTSEEEDPRAASPVNAVALLEETAPLEDLVGGAHVRVESSRGP